MDLAGKAQAFKDLHDSGCFILPNAWDVGSARMIAGLGAEAIATTSAGFAFSQGALDAVGLSSREAVLAHAADLVNAVDIPVSADLEDGFGSSPEDVAATVKGAIDIGLCGCTIEDTTGDPGAPIHEFGLTVERIVAAVEAARSAPYPFMLTARAENYLHGRPDLDDTLRRLQAFEDAGADVLYAPGLPDMETIRSVCASISKPFNVVVGIRPVGITVDTLRDAGVRRISLGSSLARLAYGEAVRAMQSVLTDGHFAGAEKAMPFSEIEKLLKAGTP